MVVKIDKYRAKLHLHHPNFYFTPPNTILVESLRGMFVCVLVSARGLNTKSLVLKCRP